MYKIYIKNRGTLYKPIIGDKITVTWQRGFQAGTLSFEVIKDSVIDYQEGNQVFLMDDDEILFVGYVFKKNRTSKQIIETTCYDQLRYLKNKDALQYEDKTYSELLKMICNDHFLQMGEIEDTKFKIPLRTERDKEYFQMLQTAHEITLSQTGKEFVLYDDKGKICLKEWINIPTMEDIITYDITQDFNYTTDIDNAYNRIKINYIDDLTKEVKTFVQEDENSMLNWGRLQYYAETSTLQDIDYRAKTLLNLLNRKHRSLKISKTLGDWNVRAGSLVPVYFPFLGDIHVNSLMLVDKVTHTISGQHHFMELEVFNKDIMPNSTGKGLFEGAKSRQKQEAEQVDEYGNPTGGSGQSKASDALSWARDRIGWKYSQGSRLKEGYADCSSLIMRAYQAVGLLPTKGYNLTSRSIHGDSHFEEITKDQLRPGDVMWCNGHLAFYAGGNTTLEARWSTQKVGESTMGNRFTKFYRVKGSQTITPTGGNIGGSIGKSFQTGAKMVNPISAGARVTSNHGWRVHPTLKTKKYHDGIDYSASTGTPVKAAQGGTVTFAGSSGSYGNLIKIQHPDGTETRYAHLSKFNVKKGQNVSIGQKIGAVGATGRVTGPHLHFEIRKGGKSVNPAIYV